MRADDLCEVIISAPEAEWLVGFTRSLVEDRLCASGQHTVPIRSIYRWKGEIYDKPEARVALRTRAGLVPEIVRRTRAEHPYEVASVVALGLIDGNPDYLEWMRDQTREP